MPEFTAVTMLYLENMINGDTAGIVSLGILYGALAIEKEECGYKLFKIWGDMNFHEEKAHPKENKELAVEFEDGITKIYFMNKVERTEIPSNASELNQELNEHPYFYKARILSFKKWRAGRTYMLLQYSILCSAVTLL